MRAAAWLLKIPTTRFVWRPIETPEWSHNFWDLVALERAVKYAGCTGPHFSRSAASQARNSRTC